MSNNQRITREQAAHRLGVSVKHVDRLIAGGWIKAINVSTSGRRCVRISTSSIDQYEQKAAI